MVVGSVSVAVTRRAPQGKEFLQPGAYIAVLQPLTLWDEHLALIRPDFSAGHLFPEPSLNLPLLQTLLRPRRGPGWPWAAFVSQKQGSAEPSSSGPVSSSYCREVFGWT